ncbi:MAG TPA: UDP-glucose/GDP-mannose dehydrogenase family protein, partial [Chloroflexota bacterium]|nr:UDP-glucose/GDP-mannose dehydrogenase family protein [Chloroflexota bacterium]
MSNICVIGTGYVGLVTGACLADLGNDVTCVDIDEAKVARLNAGQIPIYEPGLEEVVGRNVRAGRLHFTGSYASAVPTAQFIYIAVNTPAGQAGEANMSQARSATQSIAQHLGPNAIIINKSTMPIGTGDWVTMMVGRYVEDRVPFSVVSNPEFLREGSAIADFMNPDRVVLGSTEPEAAKVVAELYAPLNAPVMITDLRTAEMIKYASNAFLATKISFINEMAAICERLGADVKEVARGMGLDKRVGPAFLEAGVGYGGSCFPKDIMALAHMAAVHGCHPQLLRAVMDINHDARRSVLIKIREGLGSLEDRRIGVLGLAFKPNTDDLREAPALEMIHLLLQEGAHVQAFDPAAMELAQGMLPSVHMCSDA